MSGPILAIDTSSRRRALCVLAAADGGLLAARRLEGRHLDRTLPAALGALLGESAPTAVAVVLGPGSYTGLRVGIAAALGLAHARDLPLHGIAALDAVARAAPPQAALVEAVADAGRGALYAARYQRDGGGLRRTDGPRRVDPGAWRPAPGHVAVTLDALDGALPCDDRAAAALAEAAAAAASEAPLPRAGLEPVYLGGDASAPSGPRV
ncbi:MAG TPA: tRNA (adenosine(37)-N6)-threonylcarbamoyltransferase complex dimerization subunit type 1 TsaB [Candidatus Dormibacteraeota bacterium]|nr:tRNA (adenosine(37)-N6)-threonylcarbamoyltransferase complex dimerization subunit type 1 TsaB [Candidatus Dormibacteraeota bacterium]